MTERPIDPPVTVPKILERLHQEIYETKQYMLDSGSERAGVTALAYEDVVEWITGKRPE